MSEARRTQNGSLQQESPDARQTQISYWFLGKIALFPVIMMFLAGGAVALLTLKTAVGTDQPPPTGPGLTGFFASDDLSYGLVGLILSIICAIMLIFFLFWHVIRMSFIFDAQEGKFTVCKHGIFRYVAFNSSFSSFHPF